MGPLRCYLGYCHLSFIMSEMTKICTFDSMPLPHLSTKAEILIKHQQRVLRHTACAPHTSDTLSHVWHSAILAVWLLRHIYNRFRCKQYGTGVCLTFLNWTCEWQHSLIERLLTGFFCDWGICSILLHCAVLSLLPLRCSEYPCGVRSASQNIALRQKSAHTIPEQSLHTGEATFRL